MSRERRRRRDARRAAEAAQRFQQTGGQPASELPPTEVTVAPIAVDIGQPLTMPNGERWIFNITKAREFIRGTFKRELHSFSGQQIAQLLARFSFPREKVDTADPGLPGIAAVIPYGGQRALQIIEGAERACRAFQLNRPFLMYVLSDYERDQCLWSKTGLQGITEQLMGGHGGNDEG